MKNTKRPLGKKCYGSIPHFSGSRLGKSEKVLEYNLQDILTKKPRNRKDLVIVQEKLDGSNCSIAKVDGKIIALTRSGFMCNESNFKHHRLFAIWVDRVQDIFDNILREKERVVGENMLLAHGTKYIFKQFTPFIPFDIMHGNERIRYHDFLLRILPTQLEVPRLIHIGQPFQLKKAKKAIEESGHGALDKTEGFIYRLESDERVDCLCKFVRSDKVDGKYLSRISGLPDVWNKFLYNGVLQDVNSWLKES